MNSIDNKEFSKSVNSSNYNSLNKKEKFNNDSSNSKKYLKTKDRYNKSKANTSIQSVNASQIYEDAGNSTNNSNKKI